MLFNGHAGSDRAGLPWKMHENPASSAFKRWPPKKVLMSQGLGP
jgi:hypothetical protein